MGSLIYRNGIPTLTTILTSAWKFRA